ncbi:MAG: ATP-binding protein [Promethearchaeota archaeon]
MIVILLFNISPSFNSSEPNSANSSQNLHLKVGIVDIPPKEMVDEQGEVSGFFPDILTYIASKKHWEIEYVNGTWEDGLDLLNTGQIDILPDVGYSAERAELYDFNNISVMTNWALVYTREGSDIKSMDNLQNKKIGVMAKDINYLGPEGIKSISERYNLNITFVEYDDLYKVLENVEAGNVDGGVVNQLFGKLNAFNYDLIKTSIVFNAVDFKFAFPKNASLNPFLIEKIDHWLEILKNDENSYYYERYNLYFSEISEGQRIFPPWIIPTVLGLVSVILISFSITVLLRRQVQLKSKKINEIQEKLLRSQKMEAIGRFAGCIAHDFNNLLTVINGVSDLMIETKYDNDQDMIEDLKEINKAGIRGASLTKQLLAFSRKQIFQLEVININKLLKNMESMLKRLVSEDISFKVIYDEELANIFVDSTQTEQIIMNLVLNASDAMPSGGELTIETRNVQISSDNSFLDLKPGNYIQISVADTGIGMNEEELSHLFEPFYTTKGPDKGTGLGLSTVFGIVKQFNGDIIANSQVGLGTTFKVYLPQTTHPMEKKTEAKKDSNDSLKGSETILVVEDEDSIRHFTAKALRSKGYRILDVGNPIKALDISRNYEKDIDLLLTDIIMPHMTGKELADIITEENPQIKVLFISGYIDKAFDESENLKEGVNFLPKPFSVDDLLGVIRNILSTDGNLQK